MVVHLNSCKWQWFPPPTRQKTKIKQKLNQNKQKKLKNIMVVHLNSCKWQWFPPPTRSPQMAPAHTLTAPHFEF